ncbi:MAG: hypothetical protein AB1427_16705 [Thermodesulfobacteriota bacterium]
MAYNYLFDLHRYIGERLEDAADKLKHHTTEPAMRSFHLGRIRSLEDFQEFLKIRYHHKLPRRLARRFKKVDGAYRLI